MSVELMFRAHHYIWVRRPARELSAFWARMWLMYPAAAEAYITSGEFDA